MGKTYEVQLEFPVLYENTPKSVVLITDVPRKITITVEGTGWGVLGHYLFGKKEVKIDVGKTIYSDHSYLSTKDPQVTSVLNDPLKVIDVYPSEIEFMFDKVNSKRVPVKTNISLSFEQQYELDGEIVIKPDSVTVYGAKKSIDTITGIYAEKLEKKRLKESFSESVPLIKIPSVDLSAESVQIIGEIEKFTEQSVSIPIKLVNVPNDIAIDLMTDKVFIKFLVGMSKVQSYYSSDFEAVVDYEKRTSKGLVPVEIVRYPDYVRIVNQNPVNNEFITNLIENND
ncbi:MAG: hypothetical protein MJ198_05675 [Bacteroidales bacterium]|nr:hypothetical protein [Bacteroidales bacterium]